MGLSLKDANRVSWVISLSGKSLDKDFQYSTNFKRAEEQALKFFNQVNLKDGLEVEVTQMGYEDISLILPANLTLGQITGLALSIANLLDYEDENFIREYGGRCIANLCYFNEEDFMIGEVPYMRCEIK